MSDARPIVVAGGSGRLGAAVLEALREKWPERSLVSIDLVAPRMHVDGVRHMASDLGALSAPVDQELRRLGELDLIWVAAAITVEPAAVETIERLVDSNLRAPATFLAAHGDHVRRVVFAGSVEEYGDPPAGGVFRESQPLMPSTAYGISKRLAEGFMGVWCRQRRIPNVTLRLASIYGPFEPLPKAITDFLRVAASGDQISLVGDGSALRDYVYLTDAAQAFVRAVESGCEGVFNIAHPERMSLHGLALLALELCESGSIAFAQPEAVLHDRIMDVSRMETVLGFRCRVDARAGLRSIADQEGLLSNG